MVIGNIDRRIYKCISENIITTEVIITDERVEHIKDRHPGDYDCYSTYMKEIVEHPDYILESKKPNTAFVLKEFNDGEEKFQLILRIQTAQEENEDKKNSVITFLKISDRTWNKYLRNKKILYKRV